MPHSSLSLTIQPDEIVVQVPFETTVMDALAQAGIPITAPCGRMAHCGKCRVVIAAGVLPPTEVETVVLTADEIAHGVRLSCQARLIDEATVIVPPASRAAEMRVLIGGTPRQVTFDPGVVKKTFSLTQQTLGSAVSEFDHLGRTLDIRADLTAGLACIQALPAVLHGSDAQATAVVCGERLIAVERGDTAAQCYGLAFDVGTTTVVGTLVDLTTGRDVESASAINAQTQYGHDVISRIHLTLEREDGLALLQQAAITTVNLIIDKLLARAGVRADDIYEMTVVGNATMMHLFLGIPPRSLGFLPYVPVISHAVDVDAKMLRVAINPVANVHVLPNIAGFVGADTVGALLAAGLDEPDDGVRLLADVGTNCEIVLRLGHRLIACSTPAGPAFEGARIQHGMYAAPGAIEQVSLEGECVYKVIGRTSPQGICGSGLIDIGAELLRVGLMDETGRLLSAEEVDGQVSQALRDRLADEGNERHFLIAHSETGQLITLTQRDIRELQVAKAAIRSGIDALLATAGLRPTDISTLYLAGGFGSYLNKDHAVRLGMIPEMPLDRIRFIGNAAAVGAKLVLISQEMRRRAQRVARTTEHLQIAETADFQSRFAEAMLFERQ
ncbi:MAG: DUF4445 domain-containing protein [Candidatus Latescibacteria bacterium]|nr:DUF4445 domain-containing protein [Candidatus Latescibacterota bacterium]